MTVDQIKERFPKKVSIVITLYENRHRDFTVRELYEFLQLECSLKTFKSYFSEMKAGGTIYKVPHKRYCSVSTVLTNSYKVNNLSDGFKLLYEAYKI